MTAPAGHWLWGHIAALRNDPLALLDQCQGDVVPLRMGRTAWLVLHPADVLHVLENSETIYTKGRAFRFGRQLYGNSLLVSEGEEHRRQIKQIGGLFFQHAAKSFLQPAVEMTHRWLNQWQDAMTGDLWSRLVELTLAISSQAIFGTDYLPAWLTETPDARADQILNSYDVAMSHVSLKNFSLFPLPDWIPTSANRRYRQAIHTLNLALSSSVEKRLAGNGGGGFLDALVALHRENSSKLSRSQLRDQALILLLGGYESTATALCWTILQLARHDEIRTKVQTEIRRVVATGLPQPAHVPTLTYTNQTISESLRLYPPPWLIPRTLSTQDTLPSGCKLQPGEQIFLSPYRTQRDPRFFENPLQFAPHRFDSSSGKSFPPGSYFPFGLGPRHCIGESIARMQLCLIISTLFQSGEFQELSDVPTRPKPLLTLRPALPVRVRFLKR